MEIVEINNYVDLFLVLDRLNESIDWNTFYAERVMKAPFLANNMLPDNFGSDFEIVSIEKCGQEITEEYMDIPLLYGLVMKLK